MPGSDETGELVDVTVGLIVHHAFAEPDDLPDAEVGPQQLFDVTALEAGVAVGIEQAFLGHQSRALAVDVDCAVHVIGRVLAVFIEAVKGVVDGRRHGRRT